MAAEENPTRERFALEEYLVLERLSEGKCEYLDGEIVPLDTHTGQHTTIAANLSKSVLSQLRDTLCRALSSEIKIRTARAELFAYPDLIVYCGEPRYHDHYRDVLVNPAVLFEVYSPTSEAYDRGHKFSCYQHLESLTDYVLIAEDEPRIEHFARQTENSWLLTITTGLDGEISIDAIDCVLRLSEIYDRTSFKPVPVFRQS